MRHLRMHMLASQGYCVIQIDSRGSQHRGLRFESHLRGKMVSICHIDFTLRNYFLQINFYSGHNRTSGSSGGFRMAGGNVEFHRHESCCR